jgi:hypothetical protein
VWCIPVIPATWKVDTKILGQSRRKHETRLRTSRPGSPRLHSTCSGGGDGRVRSYTSSGEGARPYLKSKRAGEQLKWQSTCLACERP